MSFCKRILIADDEEDITWIISRCLTNLGLDLEIQCALNGDDAFELLQQRAFDLIVSDIRMPGRDGLELTMAARQLYPGTKVIIMTAYGSSDVMARTDALGGFFYIEKPFDIGHLRHLILEALELEDVGFTGAIEGAYIRELVELNCARKRCLSLHVSGTKEDGAIYFKDGNIVHAECGALKGESAFFNILNWRKGTFKISHNFPVVKRTISRDWRMLLHQCI